MVAYRISKSFKWQGTVTERVASVCRMFGLTVDGLAERRFSHACHVEVNAGDIIYITGPSGAGKSVLLAELENAVPACDRVNLVDIHLPGDKAVIDCMEGDLLMSLEFLSLAGLSDCFCILSQPNNLSAGQKYRFRLAMALAARKKFVFADEFCCGLDRLSALVISHSLRRFAKRRGSTLILASSRDDILLELAPDAIVESPLSGPTQVFYKHIR